MPCMIICTRAAPPPCACGALSRYQCDGPKPHRKSGTCDRHLCARHAQKIGPDRHHCPDCAAAPKATPPASSTPQASPEPDVIIGRTACGPRRHPPSSAQLTLNLEGL